MKQGRIRINKQWDRRREGIETKERKCKRREARDRNKRKSGR